MVGITQQNGGYSTNTKVLRLPSSIVIRDFSSRFVKKSGEDSLSIKDIQTRHIVPGKLTNFKTFIFNVNSNEFLLQLNSILTFVVMQRSWPIFTISLEIPRNQNSIQT